MSTVSAPRRSVGFALLLGLVWLASGCGSGGDPPAATTLPTGRRAGRLMAPSGAAWTPAEVTVESSLDRAAPAGDGAFELTAFRDDPLFMAALSPAGNVVLMGFVDAAHPELSARGTAEALAYFGLGGFLVAEPADRQRLLNWLREAPELDALASALADAVAADVDLLGREDSPLADAVRAAVAALLADPASRAVLVQPADARSGLRVNLAGVNGVRVVNEYRRRAHVFIERVSYVPPEGGDPVPAPEAVTDFQIPPVTGLKSTAGTIVDLVLGNVAYAPVSSEVVRLPVIPVSARKTTYKVSAVGAGADNGDDWAGLTPEQQQRGALTAAEQLIFDMFLPLVINVLAPNHAGTQQVLEKMRLGGLKGSLILGFTQAAPDLLRKLGAGDTQGAFLDAYNAFVADSTLREQIFTALIASGLLANAFAGEFGEQANRVFLATAKGLRVLRVLDAALQSLDTLTMGVQLNQSHRGDAWLVDVTPVRVRLTPATKRLSLGQSVTLTATVPEVTGEDLVLAYRWSNPGAVGTLTDGQAGHQNNFDSSRAEAVYTAGDQAEGTDTVTVEVFEVKPQNEGGRVSLGRATAAVTVADEGERMLVVQGDTLATMLPDGDDLTPLAGGRQFWQPRWSPERSHIAFGSPNGIHVIGADGTGLRKLTDQADSYPSWSPDGAKIAFTRLEPAPAGPEFSLLTVAVADGTVTRLTPHPDGRHEYRSSWSPDGSVLVTVSSGEVPDGPGGERQAWHAGLVPAGGGPATLLFEILPSPGNVGSFDWFADGESFVYSAQVHGEPALDGFYRASRSGGGPTKLVDLPERLPPDLALSPDEAKIAFVTNFVTGPLQSGLEVYTVDLDGGQLTQVGELDDQASAVDW